MKIKMIGIDHNNAAVDIREKFSFTKSAVVAALEKLNSYSDVSGSVVISTCNRIEIWTSFSEEGPDLVGFLAKEKNIDRDEVEKVVTKREGDTAIRHLFYMTGGLESMIVGDDQILTQLKEALAQSRDNDCTDSYLEVLFRMAITAGKKVRNEVNFDRGNRSAAPLAVEYFKEQGFVFEGKKCLVIGNGEIGKLAAVKLKEEGADVTVTVRQYRSGMVCIPKGCHRINYGDRYDFLPDCDYVFSATSSPNFTIKNEGLETVNLKPGLIFVDLAVPRDIDSEIAKRADLKLYDIDSLEINRLSENMRRQSEEAKVILEKEIDSFLSEQSSRRQLKNIQNTGKDFGEEVAWRMEKQIRKLSCSDDEKAYVYELVKSNSDKVMEKYLFSLQKELSADKFSECIKIFKNVL